MEQKAENTCKETNDLSHPRSLHSADFIEKIRTKANQNNNLIESRIDTEIEKSVESRLVKERKAWEEETKLLFHSKNCEYDVVKDVVTRHFCFELTEDDDADFDIIWHSVGMKCNLIKRLKSYQKYNHFPAMNQLANK